MGSYRDDTLAGAHWHLMVGSPGHLPDTPPPVPSYPTRGAALRAAVKEARAELAARNARAPTSMRWTMSDVPAGGDLEYEPFLLYLDCASDANARMIVWTGWWCVEKHHADGSQVDPLVLSWHTSAQRLMMLYPRNAPISGLLSGNLRDGVRRRAKVSRRA